MVPDVLNFSILKFVSTTPLILVGRFQLNFTLMITGRTSCAFLQDVQLQFFSEAGSYNP